MRRPFLGRVQLFGSAVVLSSVWGLVGCSASSKSRAVQRQPGAVLASHSGTGTASVSAARGALPDSARWLTHIQDELLPFWDLPEAQGTPVGNFPTFRCDDGGVYPTAASAECKALYGKAGTWITDCVGRDYVRMKNRQVYLNGVAYHVTGNLEYLRRMRAGLDWLRKNAYDATGIPYSFFEGGKAKPPVAYRTSQDLSYSLLGLAFYYYLTQDPNALKEIERVRDYVFKQYVYKSDPQLIAWVQTTKETLDACETHDVGLLRADSKEIVAILDQVNAYMLLVARTVPADARAAWLGNLHQLAQDLRVRFYNDPATTRPDMPPSVPKGFFAGCLISPGNSTCDFEKGTLHHTDYGHSIKTFWMLYLIGREANDADMVSFATSRGADLLARAFMSAQGYWAQTDRSISPDWDKPVWWIYAELDQAAATFGLKQPELTRYLRSSYAFWLSNFIDREHGTHEVWHMRPQDSPSNPIPKAHLWKNGFHSFEHALVALITSAQFEHVPVQLYFALVGGADPSRMHPYYFDADQARVISKEPIGGDMAGFTKYTMQFAGIR